ncbi:MAG: glycosyltransferase [Alkalispirochaetaceae bacterium]
MEKKVSVVIPAYNEEELLPILLDSLREQTFHDFEVIVADANSDDRTAAIAEEKGAQVVEGGMPARGRNAGASVAQGRFILFLDADVKVPPEFVANVHDEMERRYADLATCEIRPISDVGLDKALFSLANSVVRYTARSEPRAPGFCIFCTKRLFDRVGGFDETITLGEDHDFLKRASKYRPMIWLYDSYMEVSVRRLEKEGRLAYALKALQSDLYRNLVGEIRNNQIEHEFGDFEKDEETKNSTLDKLDRLIIDSEKRLRELTEDQDGVIGKIRVQLQEIREQLRGPGDR